MGCLIMRYLKSCASNSLGAGRGTHDGLVLGEELSKGENLVSYRLGVGRAIMSSHHKNSIVLNPMMRRRW